MPTYEYKCEECGYRFEKFQRMTDARLTECPECKGVLRRLIGAGAGIIFKGSGFYCTDYRKPSEAAKATESSTAGKPVATPAAKS